jgi:hypothetical protein
MTTETKTTKTKQVPAFYIFETIETEGERERRPAGAAFPHKSGGGFNIVIDGQRFVAFPPKGRTNGTAAEATSVEGEGA